MPPLSTTLITLAATAALLLPAAPAAARSKPAASAPAAAQLLPQQSELGFAAQQMGVPIEGRFKKFDAQLNFDPRQPAGSHVSFTIDLSSVTLGDPAFDAELAKPSWFDSKRSGVASFESRALKALGGGRFELAGRLSLKGQSRDIVVPISLSQAGGVSTATGSFVLKRLEFKIGDGEWADTSMVANEVQVKFKLAFSGIAPL